MVTDKGSARQPNEHSNRKTFAPMYHVDRNDKEAEIGKKNEDSKRQDDHEIEFNNDIENKTPTHNMKINKSNILIRRREK